MAPSDQNTCIIDRPLLHPALLSASDTIAANNIERSTRQYITYFPIAWPAQTSAGAGALRILAWMARVRTPSDIPFDPAPDATGELKHPSRALLTRQHSPLSRLPLILRLELPSPVQCSAAAHLRRLQSYRKERFAERCLPNDQPRTGHAKRPTNPTLFRDFNGHIPQSKAYAEKAVSFPHRSWLYWMRQSSLHARDDSRDQVCKHLITAVTIHLTQASCHAIDDNMRPVHGLRRV